jgi:hypothetical protein
MVTRKSSKKGGEVRRLSKTTENIFLRLRFSILIWKGFAFPPLDGPTLPNITGFRHSFIMALEYLLMGVMIYVMKRRERKINLK